MYAWLRLPPSHAIANKVFAITAEGSGKLSMMLTYLHVCCCSWLQVAAELLAMSLLKDSKLLVAPVHVDSSWEHGLKVVYPNGGLNLEEYAESYLLSEQRKQGAASFVSSKEALKEVKRILYHLLHALRELHRKVSGFPSWHTACAM